MTNLQPFLDHAKVAEKAKLILVAMRYPAKEALVLQLAYKKRIKPVPATVLHDAVSGLETAAEAANVSFSSAQEATAVMDWLAEVLWPNDEHRSRGWLLKVE